jgi:hypothetical protein
MIVLCYFLVEVVIRGGKMTQARSSWGKGNYPFLLLYIKPVNKKQLLLDRYGLSAT